MKLYSLEIGISDDDEIVLVQENTEVVITSDMVDLVCKQLKELKKELLNKEN